MKKKSSLKWYAFTFVLVATMLALVMPGGVVRAAEEVETPYITFNVKNNSQFDFTLWLYGPNTYTITVPPKSEASYVLDRGWYAFTMNSCNLTEVGTFDFRKQKTIHVPICGATAGLIGHANQHLDASDYIRPATIQIRNLTLEYVDIYIRTLDEHHFMKFDPLEIQYLLINDASQEFVYSFVACGVLHSGYTRLYVHVPFDITCKK